MPFLNNYTGEDNFWVTNPQLKLVPMLSKLYSEDKSRGKEKSSKIMYAICFYLDVTEANKAYGPVPPDDRKELIKKQYLKDPDFNWDNYTGLIEVVKEQMMTPAQVSLFNFYNKLKERDIYIAETPYNSDTSKELDYMLANTNKIWEQYFKIQRDIQKEVSTTQKGGKQLSLSDKNNF